MDDLLQTTVNAEEGRRHSNANIDMKLESIVIPVSETTSENRVDHVHSEYALSCHCREYTAKPRPQEGPRDLQWFGG